MRRRDIRFDVYESIDLSRVTVGRELKWSRGYREVGRERNLVGTLKLERKEIDK
jgi:hypothetical protein